LKVEPNIWTLFDQVNIVVGFSKSGMDIKTGEASIVTKTNISFEPQNLNKTSLLLASDTNITAEDNQTTQGTFVKSYSAYSCTRTLLLCHTPYLHTLVLCLNNFHLDLLVIHFHLG